MGSMYEAVFGRPDRAKVLSFMIVAQVEELPQRFRDCWPERHDGEWLLAFYSRTGGGNRADYDDDWRRLRALPNYVRDADDPFDPTYAKTLLRPVWTSGAWKPDQLEEAVEVAHAMWERDGYEGDRDMKAEWDAKFAQLEADPQFAGELFDRMKRNLVAYASDGRGGVQEVLIEQIIGEPGTSHEQVVEGD